MLTSSFGGQAAVGCIANPQLCSDIDHPWTYASKIHRFRDVDELSTRTLLSLIPIVFLKDTAAVAGTSVCIWWNTIHTAFALVRYPKTLVHCDIYGEQMCDNAEWCMMYECWIGISFTLQKPNVMLIVWGMVIVPSVLVMNSLFKWNRTGWHRNVLPRVLYAISRKQFTVFCNVARWSRNSFCREMLWSFKGDRFCPPPHVWVIWFSRHVLMWTMNSGTKGKAHEERVCMKWSTKYLRICFHKISSVVDGGIWTLAFRASL